MWIVVSRPRTTNDAKDWSSAMFFGPFDNEAVAKRFARERDGGQEDARLSIAIELEPVDVNS
jgi:hypothetical protein